MSWYRYIYKSVKKGKKSDYMYNILEGSPYLHPTNHLEAMYRNASHDQKASIMLHIDNFSELTHDWDDYTKIRNKIWDDYA